MNYVYDNSAINFPKTDRVALPIGEDPTQHVRATDWNLLSQAVEDIKTVLRGAEWIGLDERSADPAPAGISEYLWLRDDGRLFLHRGGAPGTDTDLTAVGGGGGGGTDLTGLGVDNRIMRWNGPDTAQSSGWEIDGPDRMRLSSGLDLRDTITPKLVLENTTPANNPNPRQNSPALELIGYARDALTVASEQIKFGQFVAAVNVASGDVEGLWSLYCERSGGPANVVASVNQVGDLALQGSLGVGGGRVVVDLIGSSYVHGEIGGELGFVAANVPAMRVTSSQVLASNNGSASAPGFAFDAQPSMGMYRAGNTLGLAGNGTLAFAAASALNMLMTTQALRPATTGALHLGESAAEWGELHLQDFASFGQVNATPAAVAGKARVYAQDNGGGRLRLMVVFPSGPAQELAIEP